MRLPDFLSFRGYLGDLEKDFRTHYMESDVQQATLVLVVASVFVLSLTL